MYIADVSIKRPLLLGVIVTVLLLFGFISYRRLPIDLMPNVDIPVATISTIYSGVGPKEMETQVTKVLEDAVSPIAGIDYIQSQSIENLSNVIIVFEVGTNLDAVMSEVRDKLSAARSSLPQGIEEPVVQRIDINAMPIMYLTLSGKGSQAELRYLADNTIKDRLQKIDGVSSVDVIGGLEREIAVRVDQGRLDAYGLSLAQVAAALKTDNMNVPGGRLDQETRELIVRTTGEFTSVEQIGALSVGNVNGMPVYLSDLAVVEDGFKEVRSKARLNGSACVSLVVKKQSGTNTVKVADRINKAVKDFGKTLPGGTELKVISDSSIFVRDAVNDVKSNLFTGIILTTLVIFLFLRSLMPTFIIFLSIPIALISTFSLIYFNGFSLNVLSMMGLALAVGLLVDDSIVVLENIYRHFERHGDAPRAAREGVAEIGTAVIATTATIVVVFVPIAFMRGMVGQMFRQFGLTIAFTIFISSLVAFTVIPALSARLFKREARKESGWDRFYSGLEDKYRAALAWSLGHKRQVAVIAGISMLLSLVMVGITGFEAFPFVDQGEITLYVEMPAGSSLDLTDRTVADMETFLRANPDIDIAYANIGSDGARMASILVKLKPGHRKGTREIADMLTKRFSRIPGARINVSMSSMGSRQGGSAAMSAPVQIDIKGPDESVLADLAEKVQSTLSKVPGLTGISNTLSAGKPELQVVVDRRLAEDRGLTTGHVAATLRTALSGDVATQLRSGGDEYDIRVLLRDEDRQDGAALAGLLLNGSNGPVRLGEIADIHTGSSPSEINRLDRQRLAKVYAGIDSAYNSGKLSRRISGLVKDLKLPAGYEISMGGDAETSKEILGPLLEALIISVLLVYLAMVALYESMIYPLVIMVSVPLAAIGAFLLLLLMGKTINMMSMIGIIMLAGIVTKNAILLVDYTNTLRREEGYGLNEALLMAGPTRLRPILMTTLTTIMGMVPLALGMGESAGLRSPMAIAVIGGLTTSTVLTLIVVPVIYVAVDGIARRHKRQLDESPVEGQ